MPYVPLCDGTVIDTDNLDDLVRANREACDRLVERIIRRLIEQTEPLDADPYYRARRRAKFKDR